VTVTTGRGAPPEPYQSPGALHVHSVFSDGTGEIDEIAAAAADAGLEWIGMTDHDTLEPRYRGFEGVRSGVHVVVGYEWTPRGGDHALMYGDDGALPAPLEPTIAPREALRIVCEGGGLAFVAHPDEQRHAFTGLPPFPWHDWSVTGFTGIELWNYMSEWVERLTPRNRIYHALVAGAGLQGPTARTLEWWDRLDRPLPGGGFAGGERLTVGVSGVDAHAHRVRFLGRTWTIFPYRQVFRTFVNVLLLEAPLPADAVAARAMILHAIAAGRLVFANRRLGEPLGASFSGLAADGTHVGIAGEAPVATDAPVELRVRTPLHAEIVLRRDGREVVRSRDRELAWAARAPGAYRVEMRRFGEPWLYTNPIVLREPAP